MAVFKLKNCFGFLLFLIPLAFGQTCNHEVDCGYPGIPQSTCEELGCCWDSSKPNIWCSAPLCTDASSCSNHGQCVNGKCLCDEGWASYNCSQTQITVVHVVQGCHLDVGFADSAVGIINRYFDEHFPNAILYAAELRSNPLSNATLQFTAQSYVVSLYLDCPPDMGLNCPNASALAAFKEAIVRGDITYHAFPFNAELELYSPSVLSAGIALTHSIDDMFGLPHKSTLSQRDVPGMTRAVIPLLLASNVSAITVGVNGASLPPNVPKVFRWQEPVTQKTVFGMWHPYGYGGIDVSDAVMVPGLSHAMVFAWNGDNAGPYDPPTTIAQFEQIRLEFPGAQVVSSTFDNFTQYLWGVADALPLLDVEIGDTWIHGVASDPRKAAMMRALHRSWETYLANGGEQDAVYLNATRLMIKNGEHTWGKDVKSNLQDDTDWSNAQFEPARTTGPNASQFNILEESWWEQREWGINIPVATLQAASHPLYQIVQNEFAGLVPSYPSLTGFTPQSPSKVFTCGQYNIAFDPSTGAISTLTANGHILAQNSFFGGLFYRVYSQDDYQQFWSEYLQTNESWAFLDFGKPGYEGTAANYTSILGGLYASFGSTNTTFLLDLQFPSVAVQAAGAPAQSWLQVVVPFDASSPISFELSVWNKTSTRIPEGMFMQFVPVSPSSWSWTMDKLGLPVGTSTTVAGGSQHLHGVGAGLNATNGPTSFFLETIDAPIICLGEPTAFPTPTSPPDMADGVSVVLWDNLWGTNYIMWWPFNSNYQPVPGEENVLYRFNLYVF